VDVLPTVAEVCGARIPDTWPGREPSPLAGVSLKPLLDGLPMPSRPPIHLLFGKDRGLRDGEWKLVSFQSAPWELYNLAEDRTELRDVAAAHPEVVARLSAQWTALAKDVLRAPAKEYAEVAEVAAGPHRHREWTDFAAGEAGDTRRGAAEGRARAAKRE